MVPLMRMLILFFVLLISPGFAEVLPSLPAVGTPALGSAATGDPTFARKLEKLGDVNGALLEWQRIAHSADGAQQAYALLKVGRLALENGQPTRARPALERFMTTFPKDTRIAEALYLLSRSVSEEERPSVLRLMERMAPTSPWTQEAVYHAIWDYALTNGVLPDRDYADARTQQLARRLQDLSDHYPGQAVLLALAFLPGGAHLWFGDVSKGLVFLGLTLLLLWIVIYAYQHRHWPYVVWWAVVLLAVALTAFEEAQELAVTVKASDRERAMATWSGLQPTEPQEAAEQ